MKEKLRAAEGKIVAMAAALKQIDSMIQPMLAQYETAIRLVRIAASRRSVSTHIFSVAIRLLTKIGVNASQYTVT